LRDSDAHHAVDVLRVKLEERVIVLDGAGHEFLCQVRGLKNDAVRLAVLQKTDAASLPYRVTLLQGVPKGKTFEHILQKATELGTYRIVPLLSARAIPQIEEDATDKKIRKWQLIAIEAIKQCGSPWLPIIESPTAPENFLNRGEPFDLALIASLQPGSPHPRKHFDHFRAEQQRQPGSIAIWIGPEGDFTPAEIHSIQGTGALPMTLGKVILRSDTAAVYSLSVVNYELQI